MSDSFATPWTVAHKASLPMGFPRQEYWGGCHFLLQGISQPRDKICIFCIGRQILYHWATTKIKWERPISKHFSEKEFTGYPRDGNLNITWWLGLRNLTHPGHFLSLIPSPYLMASVVNWIHPQSRKQLLMTPLSHSFNFDRYRDWDGSSASL